ncbi:uncharacterized protein LOC122617611 [Drosophila teissieri]|uniref:uncharacterized protein LOC122617611 n=1 Tax=Drosophila teissieri TaxID=7243 RepID=UPI001CB9EEF7|nr:uncharacterized protein LOC122617611 [Drosophila teissieri]
MLANAKLWKGMGRQESETAFGWCCLFSSRFLHSYLSSTSWEEEEIETDVAFQKERYNMKNSIEEIGEKRIQPMSKMQGCMHSCGIRLLYYDSNYYCGRHCAPVYPQTDVFSGKSPCASCNCIACTALHRCTISAI